MTPGIHYNTPSTEYRSWDACSQSALNAIIQSSPAHYRWNADHPQPPTPAQEFGTALHCMALEPERFAQEYFISETCEVITGKGKQCKNPGKSRVNGLWHCGVHSDTANGDKIVSRADHVRLTGICERLNECPELPGSLRDIGSYSEVSAVWERDGLLCKARADQLSSYSGIIVDFKTTTDASPDFFSKRIFDLGYHRQAAWYLDGFNFLYEGGDPRIEALSGTVFQHWLIVAMETEPPFEVALYRLKNDSIELGRRELRPAMETYRRCKETGIWPGYGGLQEVGVPEWAIRRQPTR